MLKLIFSNTDSERFKILKSCYNQFQKSENCSYLINEENQLKLEKNYLIFEKIEAYNEILKTEKEKLEKSFNELFSKAKLYFTHYYQAMYMAMERGELSNMVAEDYYNITFPFEIPNPETAEELLKMSENLFFCDDARVANGGKYFANPSIGSVKVWVEKFIEVYEKKINKFNVKQAEIENISTIRQETDGLIYEICYILLNEYSELSIKEQIESISYYGLNVQPLEEECEQFVEETSVQLVEEVIIDRIEKEILQPVDLIEDVEIIEDSVKSIKKKRKKKNLNQLQFSFFFPE